MRATTPRLELRGLTLPGHAPLDLAVAEGEIVAVTGWGSSALLWVVAGTRAPESGAILVDGTTITEPDQALAARVALITPGSALASLLTAYENILLPLMEGSGAPSPQGRRARADTDPVDAARAALASVGLAESADHLIEDLSGGQQQRVAIARALASRPRLLLADQPTSDLDAGNRNRVIELLREAVTGGAAVLLASDDPAVQAAADRSVVLDRSG